VYHLQILSDSTKFQNCEFLLQGVSGDGVTPFSAKVLGRPTSMCMKWWCYTIQSEHTGVSDLHMNFLLILEAKQRPDKVETSEQDGYLPLAQALL
jgi:hypothetical protein